MVTNLPYIKDELSAGYAEYGYFMAGFPLGYVVGSMLVGKVKYRSRRLLMLGGLFVGGLTYISLGLNNSIIIAIVIEVIAGICIVFFNVHNTTICQQTVPSNMIGKVFSVRLFFIRSAIDLARAERGRADEHDLVLEASPADAGRSARRPPTRRGTSACCPR